MVEVKIKFKNLEDVKIFVQKISKCDFNAELKSSIYVIDAKSILGIFSLDTSKELTLVCHTDEIGSLDIIKEYIVD